MKERFLGANNPNFGKKWSNSLKENQSRRMKERYEVTPEYRVLAGSANRGKKFSEERCRNMGISKLGKPGKPHSEKSKALIGQKSKERMGTAEMKYRIRSANEISGRWTSLEKTDSKKIYFKEANWPRKMFDTLDKEDDLEKLKSLGVFNAKTNPKGVVRDHSYSRRSGFLNKVFPEIIRHPCNCQVLTHSENIKKKDEKYIDKDTQSLDELFSKIEIYSKDWFEQEKVLRLITLYRSGERWIDNSKEI